MKKLCLSKHYKSYYSAETSPQILEFEALRYISLPGRGDPSGADFGAHIRAIYPLAYRLKFHYKSLGQDFIVPKLEALWGFDELKFQGISMEEAPAKIPRSAWEYRLLLRLPDFVDDCDFHTIKEQLLLRKGVPLMDEVELFTLSARKVVQMLHTGPFEREPETLIILNRFIQDRGFGRAGLHHEIYLSDFRKTAPNKLRTILREPVI